MRRVRIASCILLHALLATACGGSDSTASSVPPPGEPEGGVPPAAGDAGPRFSVLAKLTVPVGRSQIFVAPDNTGATWSVLEGDAGGSVDANGRYTAPKKAGTYHLVASTGSASGEATVTVADYTLSILAGAKGGSGNLDGTGRTRAFASPLPSRTTERERSTSVTPTTRSSARWSSRRALSRRSPVPGRTDTSTPSAPLPRSEASARSPSTRSMEFSTSPTGATTPCAAST